MARTPDFNQFGEELWEIANVFRDDALHATERLETFSLFLFLKLWDEMALEQEEALGRSLNDEELAIPNKYRFHKWASDPDGYAKQHGFEDSVDFCRRMFDDLATRKVVDQYGKDITFDVRRLFGGTVFRLRYTTTIRALVSKLNELNLREIMMRGVGEPGERYDIFGRAYEYLLQKFGQNKEFAEYFTPRHIVDRMVQIIDPEIGETIYDPACGTGGFIVRAFEWVRAKIERKTISAAEKERLLRNLKEKHLIGVEHVPIVFKLALMNMILHKDGSSLLQNDDSLSNKAQDIHKNKYDVILANPPFGPTKQERLAQFEYHIKLYEALFIQHMMNALRPGGRAAVVLKEGLLFDSKKMLRAICRKLVEQFEVLAVISLPNGVFNPYSGAKTSIVVFRKPLGRDDVRTSKVWFYRVESDGRDLGATRRPLPDFETDGDLEHMVSLFPYTWRHEKDGGVRAILKADDLKQFESEKSWWATIEQIRATDYNLTAGRYCPHQAEAVEHEKPEVLINRLLELEEEITKDLQDLLTLVTVPTSPEGLKGAIRFSSETTE
ncbi:N-6 DNA methylase [Spirochaeta thermophila DSM 6578]|uniref:site-specific DNA-methyltransferase (adenine-specific) n=1 Tax=Winmispira thermophila (strain ATCC 700085 / DSM 6578 / Z-1203) TaxID=869211 RepID=G0GES4_WINT7|nr:N-6 DNA methylase [Spirochaeta thermophila]AEJ61480.1 N-6 DNA methylase [Spirochaeta thermophila DSM 6578]